MKSRDWRNEIKFNLCQSLSHPFYDILKCPNSPRMFQTMSNYNLFLRWNMAKNRSNSELFLISGQKKLGKVVTPDPWKSGARNTTGLFIIIMFELIQYNKEYAA